MAETGKAKQPTDEHDEPTKAVGVLQASDQVIEGHADENADGHVVDGEAGDNQSEAGSDEKSEVGWGAGTELKKIFKRLGFEPQDDL